MAEKDIDEYLQVHGGTYVRTSFVDSGVLPSGVQMLDTGGITNGVDGTLYLVKQLVGPSIRDKAASIMDFPTPERKGIEPKWAANWIGSSNLDERR